jgi:hypothetical protein
MSRARFLEHEGVWQMWIRSVWWLALVAGLACGDLPVAPVGQLRLGLSSGIGERHYRLTQATFAIEGAAQLTLESEADPASDVVQRSLPEGVYSVRLLDGWQLERASDLGSEPVLAELSSDNPLPFSISANELTTVTFQFRTLDGAASSGGEGDVRIAIEVDGASTPRVIFSELMKNPEVIADADGEWIELFNAGSEPFDLDGCSLSRDAQELPLEGPLVLEAGQYLTLSNGEAPGFSPDLLYSGLTLPNSGAFVLRLACAGTLLDEVTIDPASPAQRAGRSLSLSGSALDDAANDAASRWCEGGTSYNGDYGTPGSGNPDCG